MPQPQSQSEQRQIKASAQRRRDAETQSRAGERRQSGGRDLARADSLTFGGGNRSRHSCESANGRGEGPERSMGPRRPVRGRICAKFVALRLLTCAETTLGFGLGLADLSPSTGHLLRTRWVAIGLKVQQALCRCRKALRPALGRAQVFTHGEDSLRDQASRGRKKNSLPSWPACFMAEYCGRCGKRATADRWLTNSETSSYRR